jgi:lysozyme
MKRRSLTLQAIALSFFFGCSFAPARPSLEMVLAPPQPVFSAISQRPAPEWTTAGAAFDIIRNAEKLRLKAYFLAGQWLVGYGHAGDTTSGTQITEAKAEQLLKNDVSSCEGAVSQAVDVPVTRNEFSALVAFCYNVGPANMAKSNIVRRLNHQDRQGAADAFLAWTHAKIDNIRKVAASLVDRRREERALFLSDGTTLDRFETPTS